MKNYEIYLLENKKKIFISMALHLGLFPIVRTDRPDYSCPAMMRNSLLIRTIQLDQLNFKL